MRLRTIALLAGVAGCVLLLPAYTRAESIPFTILIPSLKTMGAPYWVKEGVRLSYYTAMSTVPSEREYFYKDDEGDWIDSAGKRYRKEENGGDAGHGITQINVSFADNRVAALNIKGYQFTGVWMGPMVPLLTTGSVVPACQGGDWWVHPQGLAQIGESYSNGVKIGRMTYPVNNKTYQAIRFEFKTRDSEHQSEVVFVYDTVTGLLLHAHTCNRSRERTTLGIIQFIDWRRVRYPWAGTDAPSWLAQMNGLQYQGNCVLQIPTTNPFPMPMSVAVSFLQKEAKWARLMQRTVMQIPSPVPTANNTPTDAEQVAGPGQTGGLWINPQALRTLRAGQVIDQDNIVQTRTAVTRADTSVVQITEAGKLHTTTCQYDTNTGVMSALSHTDQHAYTQTTLSLVR